MAREWTGSTVGEVSRRVTKGTTPTTIGGRFVKTGVAFVKVESITDDGRFDRAKFAFVDDETNTLLARSALEEDDVLFTIAGTIGRVARVPREVLPANTNQAVAIVRPDPNVIDPRFLYYVLRDEVRVKHAHARVVQSVQANFSLTELSAIEVPLPPKVEQRAIAHILGTLDDKIELNRRINETLEAMARALFKSWFVDFDPVRAKGEGRDPGLPQPLADLFPDSFEDSELGEIPKGWRVGGFSDVVEQLRDQENPLSSPEALFHHFSLPAFDEGQSPKVEYGESIKSQKSRVPPGVVLLSKLNPEIERVWLVNVRPSERAVCSTEFLVLRARSPFTRSFVYCLARSPLFRQQIEGLVTGTSKSHQRAQVESVFNLAVVVPPSSIVAAFDRSADSLLARTLESRRDSRTLAALREALLPKLISGELRVEDAEQFIERAT